ncbi:MAG TPA: aspartyl/asparaginyl beta-hydroxylase domain-containing protein [Candidatus Binatia bacterium]|nr:aspartyl/asparaginyl beta-hydroxylase domain-containing protein [Candidatus Binatia bacterium]
MARALLAPQLLILYVLAASALYVHFRGRVRHRFRRQLLDHSTFMAPYNALMYLTSAVPATPFVDTKHCPELDPLRERWPVIRDEALRLYEGAHIRAAARHNDVAFDAFFRRGWKRFYLKWYDDVLPSARELCPETVALVQSIPSINAALFALLPPHSRLGEHRDPFAGSLRYHLGLVTPNSDDCRIYVDGAPYSWRDGEAVLFDETYVHSAVNDTDVTRIILFCDVTRPIRYPVMRAVNRFVTRHIVKATAAQNTDTEKVGVVNQLYGVIHRVRDLSRELKRSNRRLYYALKYAVLALALYLVFFSAVIHRG